MIMKLLKSCFALFSVNQLSVYGAVADMCEELASPISDYPASTGKLVAQEKPEKWLHLQICLTVQTHF